MFFHNSAFSKELANPRRILIIRLGVIGEVIHTVPLLVALRTRFPKAEIAWLIDDKTAKLLLDHWAIDRLVIVQKDKKDIGTSTSEMLRVLNRLRAFAPDVTIDTQGNFLSAFAAWISGAKHRIGFGNRRGSWLNNHRIIPDAVHTIDQNMQLLKPVGVFGSSIDFDMPECEMDRCSARNILNYKGLHGNFAILNVGAGWKSKLWKEERYGLIAKYLLEQWNLPSLVVWGRDDEESMAENVVHVSEDAAVKAPPISLGELASISRLATLFIGSDTGPLHIAAAAGTRCIGLYGPNSALRDGPYGIQNRSIQVQHYEGTHLRLDRIPQTFMDAIDTELVCDVCDEILTDILRPSTMPMTQPSEPMKKAA
ncbi:heptosyltransferase [Planctomycetales bacterium]|nr:heptosyltransferase [Planctomycetales bacterium]